MDPKNHSYPALSDVYGRIDQVLLSIPDASDSARIKERYGGLFDALGGCVKFIILGSLRDEQSRKSELQEYQQAIRDADFLPQSQLFILEPDFSPDPRPMNYTTWVQDPFCILRGHDGAPIFLEPYYFGKVSRSQDQYIAEQVSAYTGYLLKSTRYFFEGGNLAVGDNFMLVGRDTLLKNLYHYYPSVSPLDDTAYEQAVEHLTEEFKRVFGVNYVVWLGLETPRPIEELKVTQGDYGTQPFFHLDMYLTLGGKSPDGEELVFLGRFREEEFALLSPEQRSKWEQIQSILDNVHQQLRTCHKLVPGPRFKVVRVPIGLRILRNGSAVPLSMNNCLVEVYAGLQRVYLPKFDSRKEAERQYLFTLMQAVENVFRSNGFSPTFVDGDFFDLAATRASLHCIVKVIRRNFYPF